MGRSHTGQSAAATPPERLALGLLTLGTLHLQRGESGQIVRHRYMLLVYMAILPFLMFLDTNPQAHGQPAEVRGPVYMAAMAATMVTIGGLIELAFRQRIRRLPLSAVLALANVAALAASEGTSRLILPAHGRSLAEFLLAYGGYWVMAEVVAALVIHNVMPAILAELRDRPIKTLADTALDMPPVSGADQGATRMHGTETLTPDAPVEGYLVVDQGRFSYASLQSLQAYGNYVLLRDRSGQRLVTGPLARLVAEIPPVCGFQVHRSHWVAASALRGWSVKGGDIRLNLVGDHRVPVAVTRRREVRDWLERLNLPQDGGRA